MSELQDWPQLQDWSQLQECIHEVAGSLDRAALTAPPEDLLRFAKEETFCQQGGTERRRYRRYSLITNVIVVPLDARLSPIGPPVVALSSGLSLGGIRLIHTDPAPSDYLFVEIEGQPVRYVVWVLRSLPVGHCFEIAGQILNTGLSSAEMATPQLVLPDGFTPTDDDLLHWAGVNEAARLLGPSPRGQGSL